MHARRPPFRTPPRGFTLIELLIVIAIIAMLSALAIAGYRRYIHAAQSSEVRVVFGQIRSGEEAYRVETLQYLSCSTLLTDYYPNSSPNDDSRWVWERSADLRYTNSTNGWAMLSVHTDSPVRYGYAVKAGLAPNGPGALDPDFSSQAPAWPTTFADGTPWFAIAARNKHNPTMAPSLAYTTSYDGTIYSEGDGD